MKKKMTKAELHAYYIKLYGQLTWIESQLKEMPDEIGWGKMSVHEFQEGKLYAAANTLEQVAEYVLEQIAEGQMLPTDVDYFATSRRLRNEHYGKFTFFDDHAS